jgi:hypothetical protein
MNTQSTEMRKHLGKMRKQYVFLLAESTEMRKHLSKMRKQYTFLLINLAQSIQSRIPKITVV